MATVEPPSAANPGASTAEAIPVSARPRRGSARLRASVLCLACSVLAACGTPQALPAVEVGRVAPDSPLRAIELRRVDSFTTLDIEAQPI